MSIRFLIFILSCASYLVDYTCCGAGFQTGFPYCYIQGNIVHFNKLLKDKETCTIYKCKKGKKPVVESYKCKGLDHMLYGEFYSWCVSSECPTS